MRGRSKYRGGKERRKKGRKEKREGKEEGMSEGRRDRNQPALKGKK